MKRTWISLGLDQYLSTSSWDPEQLTQSLLTVGYSLLKQSNFRDASLLMESARRAGLADPWLADCEARALLFQGALVEANAIWLTLTGIGDNRLQSNVQKMLSYCSFRMRTEENERIEADIHNACGDLDLLCSLWTQFPDSKHVEESIHNQIRSRLSLDDPSWREYESSLQDQMIALAAGVTWLSFVQKSGTKKQISDG